ncbi:MAG: Uma2 family endonuclease [Anaerolineae bacterium]|nr:Uma2 family endonuclease [Gloeobacterales cyanobacterium ES-bin-313]
MTTSLQVIEEYPSGDGTPLAETFAHVYAILMALEVLKQFLEGQQATVLANQFMHYVQNGTKGTVAPDVMVIFGVKPGGRDSYVIEKEGAVPSVVFEMTSPGTKAEDKGNKKNLYARLGVQEYWLFDPKGEWIKDKLNGYRLITVEEDGILVNRYEQITDGTSQPLGLRLVVEGDLIGFYRLDNGQKLLIPSELAAELRRTSLMLEQEREQTQQERQRADQAEERAIQAEQQAENERIAKERMAERLRALGLDPDEL